MVRPQNGANKCRPKSQAKTTCSMNSAEGKNQKNRLTNYGQNTCSHHKNVPYQKLRYSHRTVVTHRTQHIYSHVWMPTAYRLSVGQALRLPLSDGAPICSLTLLGSGQLLGIVWPCRV